MAIINPNQPTVNIAVPVPTPVQQPQQQQLPPQPTQQPLPQSPSERFVQKPFTAVHSLIFPYRS